MAPRQNADQQLLNDFMLSDDDFAYFRANFLIQAPQMINGRDIALWRDGPFYVRSCIRSGGVPRETAHRLLRFIKEMPRTQVNPRILLLPLSPRLS
jgi:hypothetical protein